MRNLSRFISAVLASTLRNPDSSQHHDFPIALKCVSALVDFSLMAKHRRHTPDTLSYLERYLLTFHQTKDIFLEFCTSKATHAEANREDRELRELIADKRAHEIRRTSAAKRRRQADQERLQRVNQREDLIRRENHFNFIKIHYLSHFSSQVRRFGSISMYSTQIGELAQEDQIKEGYRRSNQNEAARQNLSHNGRQHALGMRLQTLDIFFKAENLVAIEGTGRETAAAPRRILKGQMMNVSTLTELCRTCNIDYGDIIEEMLRFTKQTVADNHPLSSDPTKMGLLPVEQFTHLEILVADFQKMDVFQIHRARSTGTMAFRSGSPRNDWVLIQVGGEDSYGDLRGRGVAQLLALFKIRTVFSEASGVRRLALLRVLDPINSGRFYLATGHIRVGKRRSDREMRIVDIGTVIGQGHVIPTREGQWIVNHRIDRRAFNEIYISKNNTLRSLRSVRLTHLTPER